MKSCNIRILNLILIVMCAFGLITNEAWAENKATLGGTITTSNGDPIAGVWVDATDQCGGTWYDAAQSDAEGIYFFILPVGTYYLSTDGTQDFPNVWWNAQGGTSDCEAAEAVSLGTTGRTAIDFILVGNGRVTGKVTTSEGEALAGIKVDVTDLCDKRWFGGDITAEDGSYEITGIPEGEEYYVTTYDATLEYPKKWWNQAGAVSDCNEAGKIAVATGQTSSGIDFALSGAGKISGNVSNAEGQALASVRVEVSSPCDTWRGEAETDADGNYLISGLLPGTYYAVTKFSCASDDAACVEYINEWWNNGDGAAECGDGEGIAVEAGETSSDINFSLSIPGQISGKVSADGGQPLSGVKVKATGPCGSPWYGSDIADDQGNYVISGLTTEDYYLSTDASCDEDDPSCSRNYVDEWWDGKDGTPTCQEASPVAVTTGESVTDINFSLSSPGEISGRVRTSSGQALSGITINVWGQCSSVWYASATSDTQGNYAVSGLLPGTYYVTTYDSNAIYTNEWWSERGGTLDCKKASPITLSSEGDISGIDFSLSQGNQITGTVTTADGQPIGDIIVIAGNLCFDSMYGQGRTDAEGKYTISGLPPGECYVSAMDLDDQYASQWWDSNGGTIACEDAEKISVISGESTDGTDFSLEPGKSVSGKVTSSTDQPLSGVCVYAKDKCSESLFYGRSITDDTGNYSIGGLPQGSYHIFADASCSTSPDYVSEWWDGGNGIADCSRATAVTLSAAGASLSDIDFDLDESGMVSGKVTDEVNGQPLENVCVKVSDLCMTNIYGQARTDANGLYSISGVPSGDSYVFADPSCETPTDYMSMWWGGKSECDEADAVSVTAGGTKAGITFELPTGLGEITGNVTAGGTPVADVCVKIGDVCGETWIGEAKTDTSGNYVISNISPGEWYVFADASCESERTFVNKWWDSSEGTAICDDAESVKVVAGDTVSDISFSLSEGKSISGKVTSDGGSPLENVCVEVRDQCGDSMYARSRTGADGYYSLPPLPLGSYYLFANPACETEQDYAPKWWNSSDGSTHCSNAESVTLALGTISSGADFSLTLSGSISGTILASDGQPIAEVCVGVWDTDQQILYGEARTDESGGYAVSGLSPGEYRLSTNVSCETAQTYTDEWWHTQDDTGDAENVTVAAGEAKSGIDFALDQSPGEISGRVTNATGYPVEGVTIYVSARDMCGETIHQEVQADEMGYYTLSGLLPKDYHIFADASRDGDSGYASQWWDAETGTSDCNAASAVTVSTGASTADVDFSLVGSGSISGTVLSDTETPLSEVCVEVRGYCDEVVYAQGSSDENGDYLISGIPKGYYYVFANTSCGVSLNYAKEWWNTEDGSVVCEDGSRVQVTVGETLPDIDFALAEIEIQKGDFNYDGVTDIADAIVAFQISAGISPATPAYKNADANGDGKLGMADGICVLLELISSST